MKTKNLALMIGSHSTLSIIMLTITREIFLMNSTSPWRYAGLGMYGLLAVSNILMVVLCIIALFENKKK